MISKVTASHGRSSTIPLHLQCKADQLLQVTVNDTQMLHPTVSALLKEFPSLISPKNYHPTQCDSLISHTTDTGNSPPLYSKTRQLAPDRLDAAKSEFKALQEAGIICPSKSPWSSPLHMVLKKIPGKWRPCGDYRALNSVTKPHRFPLPHIHSVMSNLHGKTVFSKIDLIHAYHQIPVRPETLRKQRLQHHLAPLSTVTCHSDCGTAVLPFSTS